MVDAKVLNPKQNTIKNSIESYEIRNQNHTYNLGVIQKTNRIFFITNKN